MKYTPEQQREHRQLLCQRLRDGSFRQASGALRRSNGWCCLGVGCEVKREVTGEGKWSFEDGWIFRDPSGFERIYMTPDVADFYGFAWVEGLYENTSGLADNDNDSLRRTFDEIANTIEREPEGLLVS